MLLEIVKKGGRYMEEDIANLKSKSARVCTGFTAGTSLSFYLVSLEFAVLCSMLVI